LNEKNFFKISVNNLFLAAILIPLLTLAPVAYAQNNETSFINSETLNQAKNTSIGLVDQAPDALKGAYNQAKNTSIGLVDQAPDALKGAYNQAKNTSIGLVDQASNLIKNDTNSSKLLNQLEADVGNLINEFSSFFSR
jgi:ATPase subunit of ABC transporter with duplicated ATPase domains